MIQETVHRILNATSEWQSFDVALNKNQEIWTDKQNPTEWSFSIVNETFYKVFKAGNVTTNPLPITTKNEYHLKI